MKLTELIEAAGGGQVTPRFVRFLITEGVIPAPTGGRAHACYGDAHLWGLKEYIRLRELGFSLTQVKEVFKAGRGETLPVDLAPGLSLHVDLARLDRNVVPADIGRAAARALSELLATLKTEGKRDAERD